MSDYPLKSQPRQKLPIAKKNKKWRKQNVDSSEHLGLYGHNGSVRQSHKNKLINYNLANDQLDVEDVERTCNPYNIEGATFPAKMQNYPIALPKIDLLVGEESKRKFDWRCRVINDDAVSSKEEGIKKMYMELLQKQVTADAFDEKEAEAEIKKLNKYVKHEYQDVRERMATHIMKHMWVKEDMQFKFNRGFQDALIAGEEIYYCDIVAGEPTFERLSPLNVHTVRSGESPHIEDSDIIMIDGYMAPGQVIDRYYDVLKPSEVKSLEDGEISNNSDFNIGEKERSIMLNDLIDIAEDSAGQFSAAYDTDGNIRVLRVLWKSLRKMYKLTFIDENGEEQSDLVDESHIKQDGEVLKELWISEWWEGTKIGGGAEKDGIYVNMRPRPVQFRSPSNPSKCHPGIVGTAYNINTSKAMSLLDRMKPYQYLYNVFMYRTELAFAKSHGKIMKVPLHEIPEGWDMDKWLTYAYAMNIAVVDSFKEGNKGASTGKLAGNMQQNNPVIDLEMGNYIQQHINMMEYVKQQLGEIAGVSDARQGQIATSELVGNVNREITQSSHITEKWFMIHDNVKLRAMKCMLETTKHAWRNSPPKKIQHVLDDMSTTILNIDPQELMEIDYDITISNSSNDAELMQSLKQLAHAGIQNDKITFSQLLDIYTSDSISDIRRKIEVSESESLQRQQEEQQQAMQMQQQAQQAAQAAQQAEQDFEAIKLDAEIQMNTQDNETKLTIAGMQQQANLMNQEDGDGDDNGIRDEIDLKKINQMQDKINKDYEIKNKQLNQKDKQDKDNLKIKKEELKIKRKQANKPTASK